MANYSTDELANALVQRGGYNPTDARNAAMNTGGRADELAREFLGISSGGSGGGSGQSSSLQNPIDLARQFQQFNVEANQPAIQSLQAGIPEIQRGFQQQSSYLQGQVDPLKQRYQNLLDQVTKSTQTGLSREYGRRGVSTMSGEFDKQLGEQLNPELSNINIAQGQDLGALMNQIAGLGQGEAGALRDVYNQIAQLQGGNALGALSAAGNWQGQLESARQFDVGQAFNQQQASKPSSQVIESGGRKYLLTVDSNGNIVSKQDLGSSSSGSSLDLAALLGLSSGTTESKPTSAPSYFQPLSTSQTFGGSGGTGYG